MILSNKEPWADTVYSVESGRRLQFHPVENLKLSIMEIAQRAGALNLERDPRLYERSFDLDFNPAMTLRVSQAWGIECHLDFSLINAEKVMVHQGERADEQAEALVLYDLDVRLSGPSMGYTLTTARAMTSLWTSLCEIGEMVTAQYGGHKIGFLREGKAK